MFLTEADRKLTAEFLNHGYIIRPAADRAALDSIRDSFVVLAQEALGTSLETIGGEFLDHIHEHVEPKTLNEFRLKMIRGINKHEELRYAYYRIARPYLEALVGNELAMQLRVNLSIQLPGDDSSLLPLHADTWSGDSPFEVVVWIPLVNCYGSKAMYLLPPAESAELSRNFSSADNKSSEALYMEIADEVEWLGIDYGDVLVFNQGLPHGNRVNRETETRWSMNCRFKSVFSPYGDKRLGEFFEPITLRAASRAGMEYCHPGEKKE